MLASVSVVPRASFRHSCSYSMNSPSKALRNMLAQTRSNGLRTTRQKCSRSDIWNPFAIPISRLPRSGIGKHTCAGKEYRTRHARRQRRPALPHIVRGQESETNGERLTGLKRVNTIHAPTADHRVHRLIRTPANRLAPRRSPKLANLPSLAPVPWPPNHSTARRYHPRRCRAAGSLLASIPGLILPNAARRASGSRSEACRRDRDGGAAWNGGAEILDFGLSLMYEIAYD